MGHPLNGIEYVLNNWEHLRGRFPYYVFFLFTDENKAFANFFQEHFYQLDQISGNGCMFFAIAPPPPGWQEIAREREYWRHYLADPDAKIGYDQDSIHQAARYFDVPHERLPAAVVFENIKRNDALTIHLDEIDAEGWSGFLTNLFEVFNLAHGHQVQDLYLGGLQKLINYLPTRRQSSEWLLDFAKQFVSRQPEQHFERRGEQLYFNRQGISRRRAAYRTQYPEQIEIILRSMQEEIKRLSGEVAELRDEQREGFRQVNIHLEHIQVVLEETVQRIEAFRGPFIERWVSLEDAIGSPDELLTAKQELHAEFDAFLIEQSQYLVRRLDFSSAKIPASLQGFENLLEPSAISSLTTAEMLWEELRKANQPWLDYSVCGIGLWKALEIELNRTFIDAMRVHHQLCKPGTFSIDQVVVVSGKLYEKAHVGRGEVRINDNSVIIDETTKKEIQKLRSIELGGIAGLLAKNAENALNILTGKIALPVPPTDNNVQVFLSELGTEVSKVANIYRNSHAHVRPMTHAKCQEFRDYLLDSTRSHNPLFATINCKRVFLIAGMI